MGLISLKIRLAIGDWVWYTRGMVKTGEQQLGRLQHPRQAGAKTRSGLRLIPHRNITNS